MNPIHTNRLALTALLTLVPFAHEASARSVVCESQSGQTQHCYADTRNGVTLAVQYSRSSCRQGQTWGTDNRGIWVSNGCRAQFDVGEYRSDRGSNNNSKAAAALVIGLIGAAAIASHHDRDRDRDRGRDDDRYSYQTYNDHNRYGMTQTITCESENGRHNYCRSNLRGARVDIDRQLSRSPCRYGNDWGWDGGGVWVEHGCRAVFSVH
jgi:hypothetical protein